MQENDDDILTIQYFPIASKEEGKLLETGLITIGAIGGLIFGGGRSQQTWALESL
jgi:hypothetical protein